MFHLGWTEWLPVPEAYSLGGLFTWASLQDSPRRSKWGHLFLPQPPRLHISSIKGSLSLKLLPISITHCSRDLWLQASIQTLQPQRLQLPTPGLATPHGDLQTCPARDFSQLAAQSRHRATLPADSFYWHSTEDLRTFTFPFKLLLPSGNVFLVFLRRLPTPSLEGG